MFEAPRQVPLLRRNWQAQAGVADPRFGTWYMRYGCARTFA
jgi:hypothetical protein